MYSWPTMNSTLWIRCLFPNFRCLMHSSSKAVSASLPVSPAFLFSTPKYSQTEALERIFTFTLICYCMYCLYSNLEFHLYRVIISLVSYNKFIYKFSYCPWKCHMFVSLKHVSSIRSVLSRYFDLFCNWRELFNINL